MVFEIEPSWIPVIKANDINNCKKYQVKDNFRNYAFGFKNLLP